MIIAYDFVNRLEVGFFDMEHSLIGDGFDDREIIIADGANGEEAVMVDVSLKHFQSCAVARKPPKKGYLELEDQPARVRP